MIDVYIFEINKKVKLTTTYLLNFIKSKYHINSNTKLLKSKYGKPYLDNNPIYFNISHSKSLVVLAVSKYDLGVDIQHKDIKLLKIKGDFLSSDENSSKDNLSSLTKLWTIKESISKLIGVGLSIGFKNIDKNYISKNKIFLWHKNIKKDYCLTIASHKKQKVKLFY